MKRTLLILLAIASVVAVSCGEDNPPAGPTEKPEVPGTQEIPDKPVVQVNDGDYTVTGGKISYKVLRNYLSRAITEAEYLSSEGLTANGYYGNEDDERMLLNVGAKFIGRSIYVWGGEEKFNNPLWLERAKAKIDRIHAKDPDVIFQAAMFEAVSKTGIEKVKIPAWVFEAFGKTPEDRSFLFDNIRDESSHLVGQWGEGTCVPDMSREESQMWFYFMAVKYMEAGIEALHMGQVRLMCSMGDELAGYKGWMKMQSLIREAAKTKARRGFVLMDAHCEGITVNGKHLFDFAAYPLRLKELPSSTTMEVSLRKDYFDSIIGKTLAGTTPSGWYASRLPYILEFDNFGVSDHPGEPSNDHFCWGYDEISWLGLISEDYAREFVRTAVDYMKKTDPIGYIQMPGLRLAVATDENSYNPYRCNTKSAACPTGRNLEETIKELWK